MHFRASAAITLLALTILALTAPLVRATPPDDACSLLIQAQVSSVLGVLVGAGQSMFTTNPRTCGWAQPSDTNHTGKRVVFQIRVYGFSQEQIEAMEKALAQDAVAKL
jgi:hypothetical protein